MSIVIKSSRNSGRHFETCAIFFLSKFYFILKIEHIISNTPINKIKNIIFQLPGYKMHHLLIKEGQYFNIGGFPFFVFSGNVSQYARLQEHQTRMNGRY